MQTDPDAEAPAEQLRLVVPPDKLLQLKHGIEEERDRMATWLYENRRALSDIPPPANDPCSIDTMRLMSQNGQQAVDAVDAYINRLTTMAEKLHRTAESYGLIEDDIAGTFQRGPV
ncbi:PE domain-containing protein [Actinophytocola gossypii]|uniref:PE domain-containing protein n=1 Tax=Actinophytocola gossypii TaxID=2812003 RepID=A0ABT2JIW4_9PSEU|nr:PE domain-containing protein [Actinophytocola gossypii]MCT2587828.1 PE domain-containing protein [Actinophytocola gossypii]